MPLYTWNGTLLRVGNALAADAKCCCNQCDAIRITYDWTASSSRDLDTGTSFLGNRVGYACGGGNIYMSWGGDNTSSSATETVVINFRQALTDGAWAGTVDVILAAGWYSPAGGSGPCIVRVRCEPDGPEQVKTINPGSQTGCATTEVGRVTIDEDGTFTLS